MPRIDDGPRRPGRSLTQKPRLDLPVISPYQRHVASWYGCQRCDLHEGRIRMCFARGDIPADVVMVGAGPGESENIIGKPFMGPAGQLLDHIVEQIIYRYGMALRFAFTNVVCCIPRDEDGNKAHEPVPEEVDACRPRLEEFIRVADGWKTLRLIVGVGNTAADAFDDKLRRHTKLHRPIDVVAIKHPSHILQKPTAARPLLIQQAIVQVVNALEEQDELRKRERERRERERKDTNAKGR